MAKQSKKSPIKPCPFCGSIPEVDTHIWKHVESLYEPCELVEQRVIIYCPNCFCKKDIVHRGTADLYGDEKFYKQVAKHLATQAIEIMWNRRVADGVL